MKKISLSISLIALSLLSIAQGKFSFSEESHDFGTVIEGVQATHVFKFTNTGNEPIVISGVRASCGCTTPEWPKEPIAPGQTSQIKAIYNSKGRIGNFNKSIRVTSNTEEATRTLYIKGVVSKEPPRVYTAAEKASSPKVNIDRLEYNFGKVQQGEKISRTIKIKNTGKQNLKINEVKSSCYCVAILKSSGEIAPGEEGELTIAYSPKGQNERVDKVSILTNDINTPSIDVTFKSNVVKSISNQGFMETETNPFK